MPCKDSGKGGHAPTAAEGAPRWADPPRALAVLSRRMPGGPPPPLHGEEGAGNHPAILRARLQEAVEDLLGMGVSEATWEQVSLPTRLGGLGISDPLVLQPAARLAALLNLGMHGTEAVGVPAPVLLTPAADLPDVLHRLQEQVGPNMEPLASWLAGTTPLSSATAEHTTQRWWAEKVAVMQSQRLDATGRPGTG